MLSKIGVESVLCFYSHGEVEGGEDYSCLLLLLAAAALGSLVPVGTCCGVGMQVIL